MYGYNLYVCQVATPQLLFQNLLQSKKKILPVSVRKIEHEEFIDYEIEFVELSEENTSDSDSSEDADPVRINKVRNDRRRQKSSDVPSKSHDRPLSRVNLDPFNDLIKRVRHHQKHIVKNTKGRQRVKLKNSLNNKNLRRIATESKQNGETNLVPVSFLQRYKIRNIHNILTL